MRHDLIFHNKFVESYYLLFYIELWRFSVLFYYYGQPFSPAAAASSANALAGWMVTANPLSSLQSAVTAALSLPVQYNQG